MARNKTSSNKAWQLLAETNLACEREIMDLAADGALAVAECVKKLNLPTGRLNRIETAVKEAVTNLLRRSAPEHPPRPLAIRVLVKEGGRASGPQSGGTLPAATAIEMSGANPLGGSGWGFFLVEKMAGAASSREGFEKFNGPKPHPDLSGPAIEVFLYLEGEGV